MLAERRRDDPPLHWTAAALDSWVESPVNGRGFGSFRDTQVEHQSGASYSAFAHNAYAEALTSGGLLFGAPILFCAEHLSTGDPVIRNNALGRADDDSSLCA